MIEHQWERLDEGEATCITCGQSTAWGYGDCVSEQEQKTRPQPKAPERDTIQGASKDRELEEILRLLANVRGKVLNLRRQN